MSEASAVSNFWAMGGYAVYVWPSFVIAIGAIAGMAIQTALNWRRAQERLRTLEHRSEPETPQ